MLSTYDQQLVFSKLEQKEFFKLIQLNRPLVKYSELPALLQSQHIFVWAITDKSPPVKSGITLTENELQEIAKTHNIQGFAHQEHLNQFAEVVRYEFPLISHIKKPKDRYSVAVWGCHLQYLCDIPPILLEEDINAEDLLSVKLKFGEGEWSGMYNGGYIRHYVRKREAKRKLSIPAACNGKPVFVEFLYSPESTWLIPRKRWVWQRHRIVKKTDKTIFIEEHPYFGGSFLKTGWQAFIVYTVRIDRATIESEHVFYHHSRRKTYYTKAGAPELKNKRFIGNNQDYQTEFEADDVIEVPANEYQWAMLTLGITRWPMPVDEIRRAYKVMAQKIHPDKTGGDHEPMSALNVALSILIGKKR